MTEGGQARVAFNDPLSEEIAAWLHAFQRAMGGARIYEPNNAQLQKFFDAVFGQLDRILTTRAELNLTVREDRLLFGKDPVLISTDREAGLPFLLYRDSFRRISWITGVSREELVNLVSILAKQTSAREGEDLVTTLWRAQLPHLRYITIDSLTATKATTKDQVKKEEIEELENEIERIVATIYGSGLEVDDSDLVRGISISKEDLEAYKQVLDEDAEDLDRLDHATERRVVEIAPEELSALSAELKATAELPASFLNVLVPLIHLQETRTDAESIFETAVQLLTAGLGFRRHSELVTMVESLRERERSDPDHATIAGLLLERLATPGIAGPVVSTLNEDLDRLSLQALLLLLRTIGPRVVPTLLSSLELLESPHRRKLVLDLVRELGMPAADQLKKLVEHSQWFVARDVLELAQQLPADQLALIVLAALPHSHPKVRSAAVGLLRGFRAGTADRLLAEALLDPDREVRLTAIRVAGARQSQPARPVLEAMLTGPKLSDAPEEEVRLVAMAFARVAGAAGVPILENILNPGLLSRSVSPEARVAAAIALGSIDDPEAERALRRATHSLNQKAREAAQRALHK